MFRFSIRELMLLMLVTGLALGWWLDRNRLSAAYRDAADNEVATSRAFWSLRQLMESEGHKLYFDPIKDRDMFLNVADTSELAKKVPRKR